MHLHESAACLNDQLVILQHPGTSIDILNTPWQYLKCSVAVVATAARNWYASTARTHFLHLREVDSNVFHDALRGRCDRDVHRLLSIATLGNWTDHKLAQFQADKDGSCIYCGALIGDFIHLAWHCPALDHCRFKKHGFLRNLDLEHTPPHILLGIPSALPAEPSENFFEAVPGTDGYIHLQTKIDGITFPHFAHHEALQWLANYQTDLGHVSANQLAFIYKTVIGAPFLPNVDACVDAAPDDVNAWTDGSKKHPRYQLFSLAGFGVWHTKRCMEELSHAEIDILQGTRTNDYVVGIGLHATLCGVFHSSTRAELAGAILAIVAPGPQHIASDSLAMVDRANSILQDPGRRPDRPYSLQKDGDLWETFHHIVAAKGPQSIKLSWVKGHGTLEQIRSGITTVEEVLFNGQADVTADFAVQHGFAGFYHLMNYYVAKRCAYVELVQAIHDHLLDIQEGLQSLRNNAASRMGLHAKSMEEARLIIPRHYVCPDFFAGFSTAILPPTRDGLTTAQQFHRDAYYLFWKVSRWRPVDNDQQGTSWLEIYACFKALSGPTFIDDYDEERNILRAPRSLKMQLQAFILESRRLLQTYGDLHTLELIRPSRAKGSRLQSYGILGRLPCVCAELCLSEAVAKLVHYNLAMLIDQNVLDDYGSKLIRPKKLRMHAAPPWPKGNGNLVMVVRLYQARIAQTVADDPAPQHSDHIPATTTSQLLDSLPQMRDSQAGS